MFKRIKKTGVIYLAPFAVLVAGTVGCGYVEDGFVCDQTFYSRLAEKDDAAQPAVDLICHVKVPNSSDIVVFNGQAIETMLERIVFSDSTDPRKEDLKSPASIGKVLQALDSINNKSVTGTDVDVLCHVRDRGYSDRAASYNRDINRSLADVVIVGSSSGFCVSELKPPLSIEERGREVKEEKYNYTIKVLNEFLSDPGFYDEWCNKYPNTHVSKTIEALVNQTNSSRKNPFYQLTKNEQDNIKRLNYLLLLEESSPQAAMNILIPREKIVDFVDAIERLIRQGKWILKRDILVSNDLYILDESTQDKPKTGVMIIVDIKTDLDKQTCKDTFKKGLESIIQLKKDYVKKVAQNKNNVQIEAERELLTGACKALESVRNDFLIFTEFSGYVGKSVGR